MAYLLLACSTSTEAKLERVRALQAGGELEESISILVDLIDSGERNAEVLYRYGRALSLTGKPERSIWALDAAREDPNWFVEASQQLALDAYRGGNFEFAIDVFKRVHEEAPDEIEADPFSLLLEARILLETQMNFEDALAVLDTIIDRFPEEEGAIRMKAAALLGLKRPDEAYDLMRKADLRPEEELGDGPVGAVATSVSEPDAPGENDGDSGDKPKDDPASELYDEPADEAREAYWCTVRVRFKRESGQIQEATEILEKCLERNPTAFNLLNEASEHFSSLSRLDRILEIVTNAFEKKPEDPEIRRAYLQMLTSVARYDEVEKTLRKAIADATAAERGKTMEVASLWIDLAGFLMEHDRAGEALIAFNSANAIIGDGITPELSLHEAEAMIQAKAFDDALAVAAKTPVEVHQYMIRGRVAFEQGDYSKAYDELGKAALVWPDNAPIRYYRARATEGLGNFDEAIDEYRQAIRSDADLDDARERLGRLHLAEGRVREAMGILTFMSPKKPSTPSPGMRILMAEVDASRGAAPDLDIRPDRDYSASRIRNETIRALSRGMQRRGGPEQAESGLEELEQQAIPAIRGAFLRERVELLMSRDHLEEAEQEARKGLKDRPRDLDTGIALARVLIRRAKALDEAGELVDAVLEQNALELDGLTALADLAAARGEIDRADRIYDRVLTIAPDHWPAIRERVAHLVAAGQRDEAIARLGAYVDRDSPYDPRGALLLAELLADDADAKDRRIALARRAVRFSGGQAALDLLSSLDPAAARELSPPSKPANSAPAAEVRASKAPERPAGQTPSTDGA